MRVPRERENLASRSRRNVQFFNLAFLFISFCFCLFVFVVFACFLFFLFVVAVVHLGVRQNLDSQPDVSLPAMGVVLDSLYEWANETSEVFQPFTFKLEREDRRDAKIGFDFFYYNFFKAASSFPARRCSHLAAIRMDNSHYKGNNCNLPIRRNEDRALWRYGRHNLLPCGTAVCLIGHNYFS